MPVTREGEAEETGSSLTGAVRHSPPQKGGGEEGRANAVKTSAECPVVLQSLDLNLELLSFGGILGQLRIL